MRAERTAIAGAHALSPDGARLLYFTLDIESRRTTLHAWDLAGKGDTTVVEAGPLEIRLQPHVPSAAWSPDGKWLVASIPTEKGWGLFRMRADGTMKTRLTPEGTDCLGAAWRASPS